MDDLPQLLTVEEAAKVLRIGRTKAYAMAQEWRETDGRCGLPVVDFGHVLRVPRRALEALIDAAVPGHPLSHSATSGHPHGRLTAVRDCSIEPSSNDDEPEPGFSQPLPIEAHPRPQSPDGGGSERAPQSTTASRRHPDRDAMQLDLFDLPPAS